MAKIKLDTTEHAQRSTQTLLGILPDPDTVLSKAGKNISEYRKLTTDAHVFANIQQRKAAVLSQKYNIISKDNNDTRLQFIQSVFDNLDIDNITNQILNAPFFGMTVLEIIWSQAGSPSPWERDLGRGQNFIIPTRIDEKPQEWFHFNNNNELMLSSPVQKQPINIAQTPELARKFLLVRHYPTYANPYGEKILSRVFWPVAFKKGGLSFWVKFVEKYGLPWIVGKQPRGADDKSFTDLLDKLEAMVQDAVAVVPDDSSVEVMDFSTSQGSDMHKSFIEFLNSEISKAILTQTLTTELQRGQGSFAASKTHQQQFDAVSHSDKKIVERAFNTLIKYILELNFPGDTSSVAFQFTNEINAPRELAERDKNLADIGVQFTEEYFSRVYGFRPTEFSIGKPAVKGNNQNFSEPLSTQNTSLDNLLDTPEELLSYKAEPLVQTINNLVLTSSSFQELEQKLNEAYPNLSADKLEALLTQSLYIAKILGSAGQNQ